MLVGVFFGCGFAFNDFGSVVNVVSIVTAILSLAFALVAFRSYKRAINYAREYVRTLTIEFLDDCMTSEGYKGGEKISEGKFFYDDALAYKISKNYVFLMLKNNTFLPLNKTEEIINFLKEKGLKETKSLVVKKKKK